MTIREYLKIGNKRKKIYHDVKYYVEIIKHHYGKELAEEIKNKEVVEIVGISI